MLAVFILHSSLQLGRAIRYLIAWNFAICHLVPKWYVIATGSAKKFIPPIFFQCTFRICTYIPWNYGNWTVQCRPLLWLQCKRERERSHRDRFVLTLTIASFCNEGNSEQIRLEEHRIRINLILHLFEKAKLQTQLNLDLNVVLVLIFIVVYTTYKIPPRNSM